MDHLGGGGKSTSFMAGSGCKGVKVSESGIDEEGVTWGGRHWAMVSRETHYTCDFHTKNSIC